MKATKNNKIERIKEHVAEAINKTLAESVPMLQKKFDANGQEVLVGIGRAFTQLCCSTVAAIALGADANDANLSDLSSELIHRIEPILVGCGSAAREKLDV